MKASFSLLLLSSLVLFSCKKEEDTPTTNAKTNVVPFTQMATTPTSTATTTASNSAYVGKEEKKESVMYQYKYTVVKNPNAAVATTTTVTPPGMNPPHGQPKHRCDIPVGAPLNSPVAKTATAPKTTVVTTPAVATGNNVPTLLATTPETTPTPEGMNPPHGQPKHRCDIAVGAPLPKE